MLGSLLLVHVREDQAEERATQQASVHRESLPCCFLPRRPSRIRLCRRVIADYIRMSQAVRYVARGCVALYHHAPKRDADALHGALCHSVLLVAVPAAEFATDAVLLAERIPRRVVVQRLAVCA